MIIKIVFAIISLITGGLGVVKLWLSYKNRKDSGRLLNAIVKKQKDVKLSLKEAEKARIKWRNISDKALHGDLNVDDINLVCAGKVPNDNK